MTFFQSTRPGTSFSITCPAPRHVSAWRPHPLSSTRIRDGIRIASIACAGSYASLSHPRCASRFHTAFCHVPPSVPVTSHGMASQPLLHHVLLSYFTPRVLRERWGTLRSVSLTSLAGGLWPFLAHASRGQGRPIMRPRAAPRAGHFYSFSSSVSPTRDASSASCTAG